MVNAIRVNAIRVRISFQETAPMMMDLFINVNNI